jgi:hypothetical protein
MQTAHKMTCLICFIFELLLVLCLRLEIIEAGKPVRLIVIKSDQARQLRAGWAGLPGHQRPHRVGFTCGLLFFALLETAQLLCSSFLLLYLGTSGQVLAQNNRLKTMLVFGSWES